MAQKIDTSEFIDQFTDGSVRYSQTGIDRISKNNWSFSIARIDEGFIVKSYLVGILSDIDKPSTTPLTPLTALELYEIADNILIETKPTALWIKQSLGTYLVPIDGFKSVPQLAEIKAQTIFTNPAVSGKRSIVSDSNAVYPIEVVNTVWTPSFLAFDPTGEVPVFDAVSFAIDGDISFR